MSSNFSSKVLQSCWISSGTRMCILTRWSRATGDGGGWIARHDNGSQDLCIQIAIKKTQLCLLSLLRLAHTITSPPPWGTLFTSANRLPTHMVCGYEAGWMAFEWRQHFCQFSCFVRVLITFTLLCFERNLDIFFNIHSIHSGSLQSAGQDIPSESGIRQLDIPTYIW